MSKAKDRERAEKEGSFRDGKRHPEGYVPEGKQLIKCQYPPCKTNILIDKTMPGIPYKGSPPFCQLHLEMLNFYMWCMTAVRVEKQQTPSGIIIPGHEKFQATLMKQEVAIKN